MYTRLLSTVICLYALMPYLCRLNSHSTEKNLFRSLPFGWDGPLPVDCIWRLFLRGQLSLWRFSYEAALAAWRNLKEEKGLKEKNIIFK